MDQPEPLTGKTAALRTRAEGMIQPLRTRLRQWRERTADIVLIPNLAGDAGDDLRNQVYADGKLTVGFMLMCGLSAGIAALGLARGGRLGACRWRLRALGQCQPAPGAAGGRHRTCRQLGDRWP